MIFRNAAANAKSYSPSGVEMASTGDPRISALRLRNRPFLRLVIPTRRTESELGDTTNSSTTSASSSGNHNHNGGVSTITSVNVSSNIAKEALLHSVGAATSIGTLTPDIQTGRTRCEPQQHSHMQHVECVDSEFLVYHDPAAHGTGPNGGCALRAFDLQRRCMCLCKLYPAQTHAQSLSQVQGQPLGQLASLNVYTAALRTDRLVVPRRVKLQDGKLYAFFDVNYGDLHGYIRERQRLRECEARRLFRQIVEALIEAHRYGLVLRDLKLRKLVFADPQRTRLLLDGITDGVLLDRALDDQLAGPHQCCPAYLSPEVLDNARTGLTYSGRASDCWSLGVILFTMVTGRYPFWSAEPVALFERITAAQYCIPEHCSPAVRSLIAALLRKDQIERLTVGQVLQHPWLVSTACADHVDQPCLAKQAVCGACATSTLSPAPTSSGTHSVRHAREYASTNANANSQGSTHDATQWLLAPVVGVAADLRQTNDTNSTRYRLAQTLTLMQSINVNNQPSTSAAASAGNGSSSGGDRSLLSTLRTRREPAPEVDDSDVDADADAEAEGDMDAESSANSNSNLSSGSSSRQEVAANSATALNRALAQRLDVDSENTRERAINAAESEADSASNNQNHYRASAASNSDAFANANAAANASVLFYGIAPSLRVPTNAYAYAHGDSQQQQQQQSSFSSSIAPASASLLFGDAQAQVRLDRHRNRHRLRAERGPYTADHARRARLHYSRLNSNDQAVPAVPHL